MKIERTSIFKRDFKKIMKKHYDLNKFQVLLEDLFIYDQSQLIRKYHDHALKGEWQGYRELHVDSDWLVIYKLNKNNIILTLTRTGSHDLLF